MELTDTYSTLKTSKYYQLRWKVLLLFSEKS